MAAPLLSAHYSAGRGVQPSGRLGPGLWGPAGLVPAGAAAAAAGTVVAAAEAPRSAVLTAPQLERSALAGSLLSGRATRRLRRGRVPAVQAATAADAAGLLGGTVLAATVGAAFKMLLLCGVVGLLVRSGALPPETSRVLSEVRRWCAIINMTGDWSGAYKNTTDII